jgi:hypothetical protein
MNREQLIIKRWEETRKDSVGASELALIQEAIVAHFGPGQMISPASIARILADHGAQLRHPEVLEADRRWREQQRPFTAEELVLDSLTLVERLARGDFGERRAVLQLKSELELVATGGLSQKERELAHEYVQWLTVWLQNPRIFGEWLALRKETEEFKERFGSN